MSIFENLQQIHHNIDRATREWNRSSNDINLVAISKRQTPEKIQEALNAGHRLFGENRVQEAYEHWAKHKESGDYPDLKLHLIGPLQTNKIKDALELFDVIETLDREKLARKLGQAIATTNSFLDSKHEQASEASRAERSDLLEHGETERQRTHAKKAKSYTCFIQVNTGEEPQKAGIAPQELPDFLKYCQNDCGLDIIGLMCIPPIDDPAALHFALLRKLAGENALPHLSMGMSADYETAIAHGATYVRVGTSIFGERD